MTETTFTDDSGDVRFSGKIKMGGTPGQVATVQANGTLAPAPGGGSTKQETVTAASHVTIADGDSGSLTFARDAGDVLLDYTSPAAPTVIEAGTYIFIGGARNDGGPQLAGWWEFDIQMGAVQAFTNVDATLGGPWGQVTSAAKLAAGDFIAALVVNNTGGQLDFVLLGFALLKIA